MSKSRRSFTAEYKVEAAHRVIDSGRTVAEIARELGTGEQLLGRWVHDERVGHQPTLAAGPSKGYLGASAAGRER